MRIRTCLIAAALPLAAAVMTPAQAGFLPQFEGYSVFSAGLPACPLCDSTVSFAVYQTEDNDWTDDAAFGGNAMESGVLLPGTPIPDTPAFQSGFAADVADKDTNFVFLYQVVNTDPLGGAEQVLENFNIAIEGKNGDPQVPAPNPYTSAGFLDDKSFQNKSTALTPLDTPHDWTPSEIIPVTPVELDPTGVDPNSVRLDLMTHPAVLAGAPFAGVQFQWPSLGGIDPGQMSSLLFLTYDGDINHISFPWSETESPGGFGAPGDVAGVKVPEPGTFSLLLAGLVGLAAVRRRRAAA